MSVPAPADAVAVPGLARLRAANQVLLSLAAGAVAAVALGGFVAVAPNRLVSGNPVALWRAGGGMWSAATLVLGVALAAAAFAPPRPGVHRAAALLAVAFIVALLGAAGSAAATLSAAAPAVARVSLGATFWVLLAAGGLALIDGLQRAAAGTALRLAAALAAVGGFVAMAAAGMFDALSLAREYQLRQDVFATATSRHLALVAAAILPALAIGFPLGLAAARRPPLQAPVFAVLNLLQTVPSIALFGLLLVPLSALAERFPTLAALGIGGIGAAPAIVALITYALLPVVRGTVAALAAVEPTAIDAARGMGMTAGQVFRHIELPLALPLLIAALRIVTVQSIGLAVVAALIGAGGLGTFVFEGLGQYAADLILLGALPAIALALAADLLLQTLGGALRNGRHR